MQAFYPKVKSCKLRTLNLKSLPVSPLNRSLCQAALPPLRPIHSQTQRKRTLYKQIFRRLTPTHTFLQNESGFLEVYVKIMSASWQDKAVSLVLKYYC
ncbi:hypothetical protein SERLA73DRAFT_182251 [Serpula lacrymans var. lacrymans S7.3]|uniref:Uncharacterized protein n=2 Tax=Serpula lacrymans var. lacrymans TaxID=341189 RepID=F8PWY8_SERL3|nr:uncharacterized protein SERLADRAFT_468809 [Serpula lacrymans var. lacrymans S7.9]EGN99315.1 hypothetical protein SERLA73DRAFT_182251 [Serpula lacrymans var. lacrymans S7.3]EGO24879.1 hypothetical protein SERLADRAFT_468809 [Serpula lacrymans var. lacrymans S7.9]